MRKKRMGKWTVYLLAGALVLALSACGSSHAATSALAEGTNAAAPSPALSSSPSPSPAMNADTPASTADEGTSIIQKVIDQLKSIEVVNLNDSKNAKVTIQMPEGWYARESVYNVAPEFKWQSDKNQNLRILSSFEFYNTLKAETSNQYGMKGLSGSLETLGYYRDQPQSTIFPNHSSSEGNLYSGMTALGQGDIYLLNCDLPRELRNEKFTTYDMIYVWIPINNEILAYNLTITVPLGEDYKPYLEMAKKMLQSK